MNIDAVILAAGGSTRLGSPKQLLVYDGKPLVRRAAEAALAVGCRSVMVVLGAEAGRVEDALAGSGAWITPNLLWKLGMGTSIKLGLGALAVPRADAVLLMLCDQPMIGPEALGRLLDAFRRDGSPETIAAAAYEGTLGVPAIFGQAHFDELLALPDDAGAKMVLMRHRQRVMAVPLPEAAVDIDTREQYERLTAATPL